MPKTFRCGQASLLALSYATYEIGIAIFRGADFVGRNSECAIVNWVEFGIRKNVSLLQRIT
ncbi:MAG: hypothetical protein EBU96_12050 [Actinobacteria bacterium]|nr:hypothetical protein [Actinomycetota bacterium]